MIHYLYTSSLPPQSSQLCTPQILCSLLQLARPYHIDGLLEAIIERLHVLLDNRNTAAVFNAAAMAAGGGSGVAFMGVNNLSNTNGTNGFSATGETESSMSAGLRALRIDTTVPRPTTRLAPRLAKEQARVRVILESTVLVALKTGRCGTG